MTHCEIDAIKTDKDKAMQPYRRFKSIATITMTLQFCLAFLLLSWVFLRSSLYFPADFQLCRRLCTLLVNHHFGFLLGNLIILTLFVKSGHSGTGNDDDVFQIRSDETNIVPAVTEAENEELANQITESEPNKYRRTRSEEFERKSSEKIQLRRSDTGPRREMICSGEDSRIRRRRRKMQPVEDLSNEEFQRKVEAFIERQQRFLREESLTHYRYRISMAMRNGISA